MTLLHTRERRAEISALPIQCMPMTRKKLTAAAVAANQRRAEVTGRRQAARARAALAKLRAIDDRSHQRWIDVLQHRAEHPHASLRELAQTMSPPLSKSAYAALPRRALRAADE